MSYKLIIFDLDGTLLDTIGDLADSANIVLENHNYPTHSEADYMRMVGAGISELVSQMLPEHERSTDRIHYFVEAMEAEYQNCWDNRSRPYDGIEHVLNVITSNGIPMAVLSNKPHPFTVKMVQRLLHKWTFNPVLGAMTDIPRKPDPAGAKLIAEKYGLTSEECVFVGDSEPDVLTAQNAGMVSVAVSWGFRSAEQLKELNPDHLIHHPGELMEILKLEQPETKGVLVKS